ncbi:RloB family protein [Sulfitobacter faviae]|uniref:RloB family protein n=1 Tax=Sulfitobacter faviae TaxID=1775881 RepID=A0ABZ0V1L6_9RHOB|nr:RloB family protein [Sulfitobacter faviae]WPZ22274.1 RloB family protein [Sulfitobacter faviae]
MPRARNKRKPVTKKTFRIFCEGAKTEPYYLKGYLRCFREDNRASVKIVDTSKNTPVQLVEEAIRFKDSPQSVKGDVFWVVYDREAEGKYSRDLHLKAWNLAKANNIEVALTNICFEYWILLHFIDSSAAYSSFDDLRLNSRLRSEVNRVCGKSYDKASDTLFEFIKGDIHSAKLRAKKNNSAVLKAAGARELPFDVNPYTDIPKLLKAIDNF